ncbi:MAG: choice-of-anchor Q domain-containing protein, partial [Blastocatellia bacterium]
MTQKHLAEHQNFPAQRRTQFTRIALALLLLGLCLFTRLPRPAAAAPLEAQATFTVTNANDSGVGSLRQAILDANAANGADTITFDANFFKTSRTVNLLTALPDISGTLTINGPGVNRLHVRRADTAGNFRIFNIPGGGANVSINNLSIGNGRTAPGESGGGISSAGTLDLTRCVISGNTASGTGGGGGIYSTGPLTLNECIVSGNTSNGGGGIFALGGQAIVARSTISDNSCTFDGGGLNLQNVNSFLFYATVSGNQANGNGGGVAFISYGGAFTLQSQSATIVNNTGGNGGGIEVFTFNGAGNTATTTLRNSLIAGNTAPGLSAGTSGGGPAVITSLGFNLSSDNGAGFLIQSTDQISQNPRLGPLRNNGGSTPTHGLLAGSPALDKGITFSATDQRGLPRVFDVAGIANAAGGDGSDIGAVEMRPVFVTNTNDTGAGSLRQAINDANANADFSDILFDQTVFSAARTISPVSVLPDISTTMNLHGPGANLLNVRRGDAAPEFRILNISTATVSVYIGDMTISNGRTADFGGGGIASIGDLHLSGCVVENNRCGVAGGGVFLFQTGGSISGCTISNNIAGSQGGGICIQQGVDTYLRVSNTTVSGNQVGAVGADNTLHGLGGGIFNFGLGGAQTVEIINSTINFNTAVTAPNTSGGIGTWTNGAAAAATTLLRNTIISDNSPPNLRTTVVSSGGPAAFVSQGYNISDNGAGFLTQATDITASPLLGQLRNNGGATLTHALLPGSPAIDKGHRSGATRDQRGFARPVDDAFIANANGGDGADIGALERTGAVVVAASSYKRDPIAQESIVAVFGENLAVTTASAITVPLPTSIGETSVLVGDLFGTPRAAPLFFVSPGQINFQIPPGTPPGGATVLIRSNNVTVASASIAIVSVEPSLFTANASGVGVPAGYVLRVRGAAQTPEGISVFQNGAFVPAPINLGPTGDEMYLVLFGGGFRNFATLSGISARITAPNGTLLNTVTAAFAGAAPGFIGLDQVNLFRRRR